MLWLVLVFKALSLSLPPSAPRLSPRPALALRQDRVSANDGVSMENPFYPTNVVVHPLVLLSTVDHFLRVNPKGGKVISHAQSPQLT